MSGYRNSGVIAESSMADVQRKKRSVVGPIPDRAVSYEMTAQRAVIKEASGVTMMEYKLVRLHKLIKCMRMHEG